MCACLCCCLFLCVFGQEHTQNQGRPTRQTKGSLNEVLKRCLFLECFELARRFCAHFARPYVLRLPDCCT
jgi:hypothetical protein